MTLILLNAPVLAPGSHLAPMLRFQPYNSSYESMLVAIHIVWAIMLWRASANPAEHHLFVDFTIWANAAHGLVMLAVTPMQKGVVMTMIEGAPLFVIAAVLMWLRRREQTYAHRLPKTRAIARSHFATTFPSSECSTLAE